MEAEKSTVGSARFVRIPFGSRLHFPPICPFTGRKNPRGAVRVERRETQMFLPIPFLGFLKLRKAGRVVFPADRSIAVVAKLLSMMPLLSLVAGFGAFIWAKDEPYAWKFLVVGFALMYVFFGVKWLWLHRVRIVRIGMGSVEVRFASRQYADEFCRLNDFRGSTKPSPKRATPVLVNDVG